MQNYNMIAAWVNSTKASLECNVSRKLRQVLIHVDLISIQFLEFKKKQIE